MLLSVRVNNFLVFEGKAQLSLLADAGIKKFYSNVHACGDFEVLKSACVYGGNNVGKTCMLRALATIKKVLSDCDFSMPVNIFTQSDVCSLGVSFTAGDKAYSYDFCYDVSRSGGHCKGFIYERFAQIIKDGDAFSEREIFVRDTVNERYRFDGDERLGELLGMVSSSNIAVFTINENKYPAAAECKKLLTDFARSVEVVDMNNIPIDKTISVLKDNKDIRERTVELIKLADLDIDDYLYADIPASDESISPQECVLKMGNSPEDMYRLTSVHKGKAVKSLVFDSTGTKKMVAIASYIIEALTEGKILVVDEIDSSLHFKLTRAIVSLFNNELNVNAQLIFTVHDVTLLDCRRLFRKDQIWFASKDEDGVKLCSLSDIIGQKNNSRNENDVMESYKEGTLGALPEPDLIAVLLGRDEDEAEDD